MYYFLLGRGTEEIEQLPPWFLPYNCSVCNILVVNMDSGAHDASLAGKLIPKGIRKIHRMCSTHKWTAIAITIYLISVLCLERTLVP